MLDTDRLNHSLSVARKMVEIGKEYNLSEEELQELFVLGFVHDIGYEYEKLGDHRAVGGKVLKESNYKYWQEVYHHGEIDTSYKSLYLTILNKADIQIDKYGNDVGYDSRLIDIKSRYGEDSEVYKKVLKMVKTLRNEK